MKPPKLFAKLVAAFTVCLLSVGCAKMSPEMKKANALRVSELAERNLSSHTPDKGKKALLFIPGYKGSELVNSEGRTVWLSASEVLFGSNTIALDPSLLGIPAAPLHATSILERVSILPGILSKSIYGPCIDTLSNTFSSSHSIYAFYYDWRESNIENASLLAAAIEYLKRDYESIDVYAHSMGGLLSLYLLSEYQEVAESIDKVALVTVPLGGVFAAFGDMHSKLPGMFGNKHLLDRAAYTSFHSAYELFPSPQQRNLYNLSGVSIENGETLFDLASWKAFGWGLLEKESSSDNSLSLGDDSYSVRLKMTEKRLGQARKFRQVIDSFLDSTSSEPRILNVKASGVRTLAAGVFDRVSKFSLFREDQIEAAELSKPLLDKLYADGDGTVTLESASLPASFGEEVQIEASHLEACTDALRLKELKLFFREEESD